MVIIAVIVAILVLRGRAAKRGIPSQRVQLLHAFYVAPLVPIYFKLTERMSYALHGRDYDDLLIALDRALFGVDPTVWLFQNIPVLPGFIEYLQWCYSLFYFLPVILGIELYRRRVGASQNATFRDNRNDELEELRFIIAYGFCLSYLGYLVLPAVGPRFTLHDLWAIDKEMPGVFAAEWWREFLNRGENIVRTMTNREAMQVVTRDAFPSGHTDMTLLTMILAFKFRARTRYILLTLGSSLIFATVYLRYHYVIDLIGGAVFAIFTLYTWKWLAQLLLRLRQALLTEPKRG